MYQIGTKLGIRELLYTHVGTYYGSGMVLHHHWKNGTEIISLEEFRNGKTIRILSQGVEDVHAFLSRVQEVLTSRRTYDFLFYNCEHVASYVREGIAKSPQVTFYGGLT